MKITDIKTILLRATIPTEGQVFSRSGVRNSRSTTLVQVETDEGITGFGSCSGNGELIEVIVARVLKPLLIGMDPTEIDRIWDKAYVRGGHKEFGTRGVGVVALSGIDVGFDLDQDIRIVRAVRRELGKDFVVMTDANQGYTLEVGLDAAAAFADCGVFWLEEPLFVEDIAGHAELRERGKVPIAVGENLNMCYAFENFVLRGAVDYLQPDVARAGGITEIKKIAAMAVKHGVPISFHTWGDGVALAASVHLSAALKNSIVMELDYTYNPLREELLREPFRLVNGCLIPPEKPGLGVELNPEALQRFAFSGSEEITVRQDTLRAI